MREIVAYSDCQTIVQGSDYVHFVYSDVHDFAGIVYDMNPRPVFELRLYGIFFHQKFPETNESEELSNNDLVKVSGSVKKQYEIIIEPVPYHIVEILKLACLHNFLEINGKRYIKEEGAEVRIIDTKYPLVTVAVVVTEMEDGYNFNVYGKI